MANSIAEASWLRQLLQGLHSLLERSIFVYCDNVGAVYLSTNPVQHQRMKHVEIDLHFVRERVVADDVRVLSIPTMSLSSLWETLIRVGSVLNRPSSWAKPITQE